MQILRLIGCLRLRARLEVSFEWRREASSPSSCATLRHRFRAGPKRAAQDAEGRSEPIASGPGPKSAARSVAATADRAAKAEITATARSAAAASSASAETTAATIMAACSDGTSGGSDGNGGGGGGCGSEGAPVGLVVLQTAVRQYRRPAPAASSCSVRRCAGGRISARNPGRSLARCADWHRN